MSKMERLAFFLLTINDVMIDENIATRVQTLHPNLAAAFLLLIFGQKWLFFYDRF